MIFHAVNLVILSAWFVILQPLGQRRGLTPATYTETREHAVHH